MTSAINEDELIRRAVAAVKRYRDRDDWWDIRQEAVLGALVSVNRAMKSGKCHWTLACTLGAKRAVIDYLYPRKCHHAGAAREENAVPVVLSLDTMLDLPDSYNENWMPIEPDPAPGIIGKVALWQTVEQLASEQELEYARRVWLNGEVADAVAKEMGVSKSLVSLRLCELRKRLATQLQAA